MVPLFPLAFITVPRGFLPKNLICGAGALLVGYHVHTYIAVGLCFLAMVLTPQWVFPVQNPYPEYLIPALFGPVYLHDTIILEWDPQDSSATVQLVCSDCELLLMLFTRVALTQRL